MKHSKIDPLGHDPYQNPNMNYSILHDKLMKRKEKNFPICFEKFDNHKHKGNELITKGIINQLDIKISFTRHSKAQHNRTLYTQWGNIIILHAITC